MHEDKKTSECSSPHNPPANTHLTPSQSCGVHGSLSLLLTGSDTAVGANEETALAGPRHGSACPMDSWSGAWK